jgi:conjugal transfer pilus assembly protein TraF
MKLFTRRIRFGSRLILLALAAPVFCRAAEPVDDGSAGGGFYDSSPKKGWYWYHDPAAQPEKPEPPEEKKPAVPDEQAMEKKDFTKEELYDMAPVQFQGLLKERLNTAVQYPTEGHVMDYLTMQDIARRKAAAFSSAVQFVTQKNASLFSVNDVYPTALPGVEARTQMKQQEIGETITRAKDNHAILFFWRPGCGFCDTQTGILKYFTEKYDWKIKPINIQEQAGLAARFNITSPPTLLLIRQGSDQYMPISVGVVSLAEMEVKCYQAIRYLKGDTRIDTYTNSEFEMGGSLDPTAILEKK